jgi:hypothetical protein
MTAMSRPDAPLRPLGGFPHAGRRWLVVALTLLSFGLHMARIDAKSIWWDESLSLYRAQHDLAYILSNRLDFPGAASTDLHPPLYFLLLHGLLRLAGDSDLVLRFPSVLFATLSVPLLYCMGMRLRGVRTGVWAAMYGALSPFYLWYAQEARMYTMLATLGLLALYTLWRAFTEHRWGWGFAMGLVAAAAVATQYLTALLLVCDVALAVCLWPRRRVLDASDGRVQRKRRAVLLWGGATFLLLLVLIGHEAVQLALGPQVGRFYVSLGVILRDALHSFSLGLSMDLAQAWPLDALFGGVFLAGLISIWRDPPLTTRTRHPVEDTAFARAAGLAVLLGYTLLPILGMWLFSLLAPVYMNSRYLIMCSPAFYLGLGVGLDGLARWRRGVAWLLGAILLLGMGVSVYRYFFDEAYRTKEDYRSAARFVAAHEYLDDVIVVTAPENLPAFQHYYRGDLQVLGLPDVALSGNPDAGQIADDLTRLTSSHARLWLVHCRTMFSDPQDLVTKWLDAETTLVDRWNYPSYGSDVTLSVYQPHAEFQATEPVRETLGEFDGRLALVEGTLHYIDTNGQLRVTSTLRPGEQCLLSPEGITAGKALALSSVWQAVREMGTYKTSLRLLDARGVLCAQADSAPSPERPTSQWPVGASMREESGLRVPLGTPPGVYRLQLWVYDAQDGHALSFQPRGGQPQPAAELGEVTVVRAPQPPRMESFLSETARRPSWESVFGGELELLAYDAAPRTLKPEDTLGIELYWRARRGMSQDYELLINWEDARGRVWHTSVEQPAGVDYPTSLWQRDELVRALVRVKVPSDASVGTHKVYILLRGTGGQAPLWLRQGLVPWTGHAFQLATVTLQAR